MSQPEERHELNTRPPFPEPSEQEIVDALKALPFVLADMESERNPGPEPGVPFLLLKPYLEFPKLGGDHHRQVFASRLQAELVKSGQLRACAAWAIHAAVVHGLLVAVVPLVIHPRIRGFKIDPATGRELPILDRPDVKPLANLREPIPYDALLVRSTDLLWEWRRSSNAVSAEALPLGQEGESTSTDDDVFLPAKEVVEIIPSLNHPTLSRWKDKGLVRHRTPTKNQKKGREREQLHIGDVLKELRRQGRRFEEPDDHAEIEARKEQERKKKQARD